MMSDPTIHEMRDLLANKLGSYEIDAFDIEGSIYWFAAHYHSGQTSNLYRALSLSDFQPGALVSGPETDMEKLCYETLEAEYDK